MLALLAFPVARARMGELNALESDLRDATSALVSAEEAEEPALLERLTRLAATHGELAVGKPVPLRRRRLLS